MINALQEPPNSFVRHLHSAFIMQSHNLFNRMIATDTAEQYTPLPCKTVRGVDLSSVYLEVASSDPDKFWVAAFGIVKSRRYAGAFGRSR